MTVIRNALLGQPNSPPHVTFCGASGTTYSFEVHPFGQFFQPLPGVYAICKETTPQTLSMMYVGETHDLDARVGSGFLSHHKWTAAVLGGATHVCVFVIGGDRNNRLSIETDLRQAYNPPLNDQ